MSSGESVEKLNVVILYQHLAYMGRAMATYLRLERELAEEFTPDFRVWRMDIATEPEFADEAERDIAAAEVIIMAVNGRQPCPPAFQRWRGGRGQAGGPPPRAIIALIESSDESTPAPESWTRVLREAATQIHSEVFVCDAAQSYPRAEEPHSPAAEPAVLIGATTTENTSNRIPS